MWPRRKNQVISMDGTRQKVKDNVSTKKFCVLYCAFLLVVPVSGKDDEHGKNFTSSREWSDDSTMPYANSTRNQELRTKSAKNEMLQMYKMCNNTCMQLCCNLIQDNCDSQKMADFILNGSKDVKDVIDYSCEEKKVPFDIMNNERTMFFDHSPPNLSHRDRFISLIFKCFLITSYDNQVTCNAMVDQQISIYFIIIAAIIIVSLLCLLMTFIVYSICPKLRNMHGYALRSYVASLFVVYTIFLITEEDLFEETYPVCVAETILYLFCYLASLLWQNVICFDILRTFGRFCLFRKGVKSNRKTFLKSSFYVWGAASTYAIICVALNFVRNVPQNVQPNICINLKFGFANTLYFMIPVGAIIVCNMCFFIFTMINIIYAKRDTDRFLKDSESKRHTDDKQSFVLYLKLFLLMDISVGLKWILAVTALILQKSGQHWPFYVPFIMDIMECLQGLIIFIVFVCKKKVMQLLLDRFGCENNWLYGKTSMSNNCHTAISSDTSSTTVTEMSTQKVNSNMQDNCHVKSSSEVVENSTI